jgi:DNA-binding transcriptional MerR regulator
MKDAKLKWYSDIKEELRKYGIPIDDISQLANIVNGVKQYGYDPKKVLNEFSNLEFFKIQCRDYEGSIARLKKQCDTLSRDRSFLEQMVTSHNQCLTTYNELESMGFGLKELKLLWHTVMEIASANNIPSNEAMLKFFEDIEEHYDNRLGFESKVHTLQSQVNKLTQEEARLRAQILGLPLINPSLLRLFQKGVSEQDIIDFSELRKAEGSGRKDSSSRISGISLEEIRSLVAELRTYGSIKSTLSQLGQKVEKLKNQITSLLAEKQDLDAENQRLFSTIHCLKQLISFFSGSSVELRNEITTLASIKASIVYALINELEALKKLQDGSSHPPGDEFVPLSMVARGEAADLPKTKSCGNKIHRNSVTKT